jgi:hypothetical protein
MKILIPGMVPPSPNELRRKYRSPFAYRRLRDTWQQAIVGLTGPSDRTMLRNYGQKSRMTVQLTIHNARRYDEDNLHGCQKPVLDALKNLGYIRDDSPKWLALLGPIFSPSKRKDKRTEIEIFPDRDAKGKETSRSQNKSGQPVLLPTGPNRDRSYDE